MNIYDLDGTVIDSAHRYVTKPDGSLDVERYLSESCTRDKIFADTLIEPLVNQMRTDIANDNAMICTARTWSQHDSDFLDHHGIRTETILHRPEGNTSGDADLKEKLLSDHFGCEDFWHLGLTMFEDNRKVIARLGWLGVKCHYVGPKA